MKELDDLKLYGIRNRQKYLNDSDWMIIRKYENNIDISQEILDKRQLARTEISLIRDAANFSDISHLTQDF